MSRVRPDEFLLRTAERFGGESIPGGNTVKVGVEYALALFPPEDFPYLRKATEETPRKEVSTKIEWLKSVRQPTCERCGTTLYETVVEYNYMQIARTPWGTSNSGSPLTNRRGQECTPEELALEKLHDHLQSIEIACVYGHRRIGDHRGFAGGIYDLLGSGPKDGDYYRLALLRDTALLLNRQANDYDGVTVEFLTEFSFEAYRNGA